jgi:hypothetical protein
MSAKSQPLIHGAALIRRHATPTRNLVEAAPAAEATLGAIQPADLDARRFDRELGH